MKKPRIKQLLPFIISLAFFAIIFVSKNAMFIINIIIDYIKGDIYVTYEDFPTISEWLQIIITGLFSFLLWKATCESNRLNENNLKLQKKIKQDDDKLTDIKLYDDFKGLLDKVNSTLEVDRTLTDIGIESKHRLLTYNDLYLADWSKNRVRVKFLDDETKLLIIDQIIEYSNKISSLYSAAGTSIDDTLTPVKIMNKRFDKMASVFIELVEKLQPKLENIVNELKSDIYE